MLINSAVCEGCGDCGVQSNCLSVVPLETPYGRKRAIDQSSCNKDYSCAEGFCPSFVSVMGGKPRKSAAPKADQERLQQLIAQLPAPAPAALDRPYRLLVAGMGGTGVITIGAIISMAAHLEGLSAAVLDLTGLAQKGGTVVSHIRLAPAGAQPGPVRLDWQQADAAILCDPVASVAPDSLGALRHGHTQVTVNTYVAPVSEFTRNPDAAMRPEALLAKIRHAAGDAHTAAIDAHAAALALFGDSILSNMFMLGYAWQRGGVPLSHAAINRAIELNGVAVAANRAAFDSGRLAAHQPDALSTALRPRAQVVQLHVPESFEHAVARRLADLTAYQDADYARQYQDVVERVAARERELAPDACRGWRWRWRAACSSSWPTRTSMKWRGSTPATRSGPAPGPVRRRIQPALPHGAADLRAQGSAHRRAAQDDAGSAHHDRARCWPASSVCAAPGSTRSAGPPNARWNAP